MAEKKTIARERFLNGGNRADGSRFEEGDIVPRDLSPAERRAFTSMGCIGLDGEYRDDTSAEED